MHAARDILLLAAEDAFEFERWRESGPVIGDIDPEARAAEIAEFEALAIPMPDELDSLRRELEHAPKVREAIRNSAIALRRSGRATASALVALGPQGLMHPQLMRALGMLDPRFASLPAGGGMDPRMARVAYAPAPEPARTKPRRERKLADATVVASDGPLTAEVVERDDDDDDLDDDGHDDDLDDDEEVVAPKPRAHKQAPPRREKTSARRARPAREWDDDDDDDPADSMGSVAYAPARASDPNTKIFAAIAAVAVIALVWFVVDSKRNQTPVAQEQPIAQQQQPQPPPAPAPTPPPAPAIDPNTGLPFGQVPAPVAAVPEPATPTGTRSGGGGGRGSGVRGGSSTTTPTAPAGGGGVNPFADYKLDDPPGTNPAPQPQPQPLPAEQPAAPVDGTTPAPAPTPAPEQPKPAEPPKADDSLLTKSKMTPAIREAVVNKVGDLQACYQDAIVGKPDLAGSVVFTISLDQDGVVTKVDVSKDNVGYGVAKCSAKKIKRWTLPSAGIPIIFDLPFDFKS